MRPSPISFASPAAGPGGLEAGVVDPLAGAEWDRLALSYEAAGAFHSAAWAKVLSSTGGHRPAYLRLSVDGSPVALVPMMEVSSPLTGRRGVSLPFTDSCTPLTFDRTEVATLIPVLASLARERKWKYFELRSDSDRLAPGPPSTRFFGHTLDLRAGPDRLLAGTAAPVRRALAKAHRHNVAVQLAQSREAMDDFYRLYLKTRRRHGLPPQPRSFFTGIYEQLIVAGLGFVAVGRHESRPIAAAVFFHFGRRADYKFGASDADFHHLRGNNSVMWTAIEALALRGFESLHFGRTSLTNDGLRRFKRSWGAREHTISYYKFDSSSQSWASGRDLSSGFHNRIFARLPAAVNQWLGAAIYPHLD